MRALSITRPGGPEVLAIIELPQPSPGPGKVLVRNYAVGVNFVETQIRRGKIPPSLVYSYPLVPGQEGAGVVAALGEGVVGPAVGTRVMWMDDPFEAHGYAEYCTVRANNVIPIADNVSFVSAAAAPVVYSTARNQINNLYGRAEAAGRWALVRNAAGGAGTAMVETATAAGLKVIAVASTQKQDFARLRGAMETIDYKSENVTERVRAITRGEGVALALNPISGETVIEDINLLAPLGQLIIYGLITGMPTGDVWSAMMHRVTAGLTISVASIDAYMRHCPAQFRIVLQHIASDLAAGRLNPPIFATMPLNDGARAHSMLETGTSTGKLILEISDKG